MLRLRKRSATSLIRDALNLGITDNNEIKKFVAEHGMIARDCTISQVKGGKKVGKATIPYTPFKPDKHNRTFGNIVEKLREWVGDDKLFKSLLQEKIQELPPPTR